MTSAYTSALREAMSLVCAAPGAVVLGQSVLAGGTAMRETLEHVDQSKLIELPVFEQCQLGMSIGLSFGGAHPVLSVFPRWNFLLCATDMLVNHLDKLPMMGKGYRPRVLIRVAVGSDRPLDPGQQHLGDFSHAFINILQTVKLNRLQYASDIIPAYRQALEANHSTILVEYAARYDS